MKDGKACLLLVCFRNTRDWSFDGEIVTDGEERGVFSTRSRPTVDPPQSVWLQFVQRLVERRATGAREGKRQH